MSDEDEDLFADSDESGDTDDLIAESKQKAIAKPKKKILKKKGGGNKRKRIPGMYVRLRLRLRLRLRAH
jgi:hypothetical protein